MRIAFPILLFVSGCVPWPTVTQPEFNVVVADEDGVPIEGATLNFASTKRAMAQETEFVSIETDQSGTVQLEKESYTQIVILAPDGGAFWDWSYCIEKPGFRPVVRNRLGKNYFKEAPVFESLARSDVPSHCKWTEYPGSYSISTESP